MGAGQEIAALIARCNRILSSEYGDRTQEEIDALMDVMVGFTPLLKRDEMEWVLDKRSQAGVRTIQGWLVRRMVEPGGQSVTVSASATSRATVSVELSETISLVQSSDELSQGDKDAVELALGRAKRAAEGRDKKGFAEQALRVTELAVKACELAPKVIAALGAIARTLAARG